ncbi:MAG: high-potential iron-sulfur protein [Stenotrophobium sp.]
MSETSSSRRKFLQTLAIGAAALPLVRMPQAFAAAAGLPHLSVSDPSAMALGYTDNAAKIVAAKEPTYKKGEHCAKCSLFQAAQESGGYAPCAAFPGKDVNANGWCRAFSAKA